MWGQSGLNNDHVVVFLPWLDSVRKHWYNVVILLVILAAFNVFPTLADNVGPILVLYWPTYVLFPMRGQSWLNNDRVIVFLPWLGNVSKHWYNVVLLLAILAAFNIFPTMDDNIGPILVLYWRTYVLFPMWGLSWLNNVAL
jgi:hypothetical protein